MAYTLLLNKETWDLTLTSSGHIATVAGKYAIAQNVSNAVRLFTKDAYYNQTKGIPHFAVELGHLPSKPVISSRLREAALSVPGVLEAKVNLTRLEDRILEGNIEIITTEGESLDVKI